MVRRLAFYFAALCCSLMASFPTRAEPAQRIIAIGDLHGDFSAWQTIARAAGLVDPSGHWSAGRTILVQMGDITDREPDSLKIIRSLQQLQHEAPKKGGKVIVLLGNHEAMNVLGDNRYTTPGEYAAFSDAQSAERREHVYETNRAAIEAFYRSKNPPVDAAGARERWMAEHPLGWVEHKLAWQPSGELGQWAGRNPAVVKIGDTLFVHGGISAEYSARPLREVNEIVARAIATADDKPTSVLVDPLGPLWYRGLVAKDPDAEAKRAGMTPPTPALAADDELTKVLSAYGAKRMVVAHTPSLKGIQISKGGRLARIDTGISRYYGGPLTWLEILGDQMLQHSVARSP